MPKTRQRIGHDGAVAAELGQWLFTELDVGAGGRRRRRGARRRRRWSARGRNARRHTALLSTTWRISSIEAIETDKRGERRHARRGGGKPGAATELRDARHPIMRKAGNASCRRGLPPAGTVRIVQNQAVQSEGSSTFSSTRGRPPRIWSTGSR
jgi:hypothetical protein